MVRGRGGQPTRGARGGQMGTRGGRINKNVGNPDFGFSYQTKNTYGNSPRTGGYNKNNSNNNYGGGQQQQPNYGGGQQQQPNYNAGQPQQNNYNNNQNQNKPRYPNNQNNNQNNRFSGNTPNNNQNHQGNNPSYNNNQNRGQNNKGQGQNQNYNNSAQNRNNNQGYNKNQGYNNNKPNQNYNNSGPQFNDNGNNSAYPQRNQNSNQQGYSNNNPAFDNNFGQQSGGGNNYNAPKPSLLGSAPSAPAPVRNEPSSDDILKEIGKVFLTSMTGAGNPQQGANPMAIMNMMQGGPGGPPPNNNPSRYDNFYNDGNQFTNYNPPMFNNYRGGYGPRGGRGGPMMNSVEMYPNGGIQKRPPKIPWLRSGRDQILWEKSDFLENLPLCQFGSFLREIDKFFISEF
uniref:Uncharacterized protein n=1 Tax=Cacopsylla melanoneura TaxID=428564 RepID=A0A8D9A0U5_9HEMI